MSRRAVIALFRVWFFPGNRAVEIGEAPIKFFDPSGIVHAQKEGPRREDSFRVNYHPVTMARKSRNHRPAFSG
jgi:hypothetical protein